MQDWTQKMATQAEVKVLILDNLYRSLPRPPFTEQETEAAAARVYNYVWHRSASGAGLLGSVTRAERADGVACPSVTHLDGQLHHRWEAEQGEGCRPPA
jgi:hypothetical protein